MIISKFNKYVEKHGRVTYIVLGVIISLMFVIFVGSGNEMMGGCGRNSNGKIAKMYGKSIKFQEFMHLKRKTDIACFMRYGMFLSQTNDDYLNYETLNRIRMVHEAQKLGYLKKVSDERVAKTIQALPWLQKDGVFSKENYQNFKAGFLRGNGLAATDFDAIIRENLAIQDMMEGLTKDVTVDDAEVDKELAQYTIKFAEIPLDMDKAFAPTEQEIADAFANRKAEIVLDPLRSAVVATYDVKRVQALAAQANAPAELKVSDDDIKKAYEAGKNSLYKGKTLDAAKAGITKKLAENKCRSYARKRASLLLDNVKKANLAGDTAKFQEMAKADSADVILTGFFGEGAKIEGMNGDHPMLANAIRGLANKGDLTASPVLDGNAFAVAMLADTKTPALPEKPNDAVTAKIRDLLLKDKALAFYNEKIARFKAEAPATRNVYDLLNKQAEAIRSAKDLDDEAKQAQLSALSDEVNEVIRPFYRQPQRSFTAAIFTYKDYEKSVILTEADIERGYEARKAEYQKVEVKLASILVKVSASDKDDVKTAKKAKIDEAYKKITEGKDFTALVKEYSEDENTKDKGGVSELVDITTLDSAVQTQIAKMQVNQLSTVIATSEGHLIFKLLEKTAPKTLADVRTALTAELVKEAAKKAAEGDAAYAANAIATEWNNAGHNDAKKADILKNAVAGYKAAIKEFPMTNQYNYGAQGLLGDYKLMGAVFEATADEPFTKAISGKDAAAVACLKDTTNAAIEEPETRMSTLLNITRRNLAVQKASDKAHAEAARLNEALKTTPELEKAAGELTFKAAAAPLSKENARQFSDFTAKDITAVINALANAQVKTVLPPQKSYSGQVLVYLDSKTIPSGEEAAEKRASTKAQLLGTKKNKLLSDFLKKAEEDSKTSDLNEYVFKKK